MSDPKKTKPANGSHAEPKGKSHNPRANQAKSPASPTSGLRDNLPRPDQPAKAAKVSPKSSGSHAADSHKANQKKTGDSGKKKMSRGKKVAIGIVVALILVIAGSATALALYINNINNNLAFEDEEEFSELQAVLEPVIEEDNSSYTLILGSDAQNGEGQSRSDVIILARLDPDDGIAEMVSIPRDTMVYLPGHEGYQKINAAYAYGGPAGAVECVSEFAGVPISHYVEVHFQELKEVVDKLGGIVVDIPQDIVAGNGGRSFSKGEQLIDGEQALAFARERYNVAGGDFGRAFAQRMILQAVVKRGVDAPVTEIPGLVTDLASCVSTDYTVSDLIDLALQFKKVGLTMYTVACPSYSQSIDGGSYVCTKFDEWVDIMRRVDANMDPKGTDPIPEPQASNDKLGAATNSAAPRDYKDRASHALSTDDVLGEG